MLSHPTQSRRERGAALASGEAKPMAFRSVDLGKMAKDAKVKAHYNGDQGAIGAARGLYALKARVDREVMEKVIRTADD